MYVDVKGVPTKVEELYLFLNSVQGIKEIITTCKLDIDEIKVACAERVRNSEVLKNIEISKATDPNKPINFFTKKCFQGCNLFSNNGLVVIISDGSKNHTLIDVETTIYQIVGRLRSNSEFDNILKDKVWHIYSTKRPGSIKTDEQFEAELSILKAETDIAINMSKKMSEIERKQLIERYNIDNLICYYDEDEDAFVYSDIKEKYLKYNFHLCNHIYKNGATIREAYIESGLQIQKQEYDNLSDDVVLNRIATVSFRSLLEQYIELRQTNSSIGLIQSLENEYPIFKQAYNELGISKIKSSGYVESKIKEMLYARSAINTAFEVFYNKYGDSTIPVKEIKKELQEIYDRLKISKKAKATDLKDCIWLDVKVTDPKIEGKTVRCMSIQKRMMYQL